MENPTGFKRGEFKACVYRDGKPMPSIARAYLKGDFAIHRPVTGDGEIGADGIERGADCGGGWFVSHVPTGRKFWTIFHEIRQAKWFVNLLIAANLPSLGKTFGDDFSKDWGKRKFVKWRGIVREATREAKEHCVRYRRD